MHTHISHKVGMFCFPTFHVCFSCFFHISVISVQPSRMNNTITHARFGGIPLACLYVSTPYIERNRALSTHRTLGSIILPCSKTLVTLRCGLKSRSGLALEPLGAPEYESRVNSRSSVPLPTFFCRFDHPEWWSLAEVRGCLHVDSPKP